MKKERNVCFTYDTLPCQTGYSAGWNLKKRYFSGFCSRSVWIVMLHFQSGSVRRMIQYDIVGHITMLHYVTQSIVMGTQVNTVHVALLYPQIVFKFIKPLYSFITAREFMPYYMWALCLQWSERPNSLRQSANVNTFHRFCSQRIRLNEDQHPLPPVRSRADIAPEM